MVLVVLFFVVQFVFVLDEGRHHDIVPLDFLSVLSAQDVWPHDSEARETERICKWRDYHRCSWGPKTTSLSTSVHRNTLLPRSNEPPKQASNRDNDIHIMWKCFLTFVTSLTKSLWTWGIRWRKERSWKRFGTDRTRGAFGQSETRLCLTQVLAVWRGSTSGLWGFFFVTHSASSAYCLRTRRKSVSWRTDFNCQNVGQCMKKQSSSTRSSSARMTPFFQWHLLGTLPVLTIHWVPQVAWKNFF